MAYDGRVLRQATLRFDEDKQRRQEQQRQRQQRVYQQCPELESIQREIRGTMGEIIASALRRGTDPLPAIRVIRDKNLSLQKRRAELLAQLGYPEDYLSEKPRCTLCGDTGYRGDGLCSCLKKYYAQEQIRELSRMLDIGSQSFDTFELDWYSPDRGSLPRSPRENAQRNLNLCRDFAARFRPGRENLLLFGAPGLGKTFLSACIARVVSEDGFSVVYDTAGHVFSQFESAKFRRDDDGDTAGEDVERCMNCDLLILDDLGTEMTTSFVQSALYQLLNGRLLTGRSTVISTNLDPEELGRRYGAPLLSRLEGEYQLLRLGTEEQQLSAAQVFCRRRMNVAAAEAYIEDLLHRQQVTPPKGRTTYIIKDVRLFLNSVDRGLHLMRQAGVNADWGRQDTDEEILLTIRIPKRVRT